jgi:hypothetical protein
LFELIEGGDRVDAQAAVEVLAETVHSLTGQQAAMIKTQQATNQILRAIAKRKVIL